MKFNSTPVRCEALVLDPSKQFLRYGNLYNPENIFIAKEGRDQKTQLAKGYSNSRNVLGPPDINCSLGLSL